MAANPVRGEVTFEAEGQTYRLVFSTNALAALEDRLDKSVGEIGSMFETGLRLGHLRALMWAGLSDHHDVSELAAGDLIDLIGHETAGEKIGQAFVLAFPEEDASGAARPQKPAVKKTAGTGKTS